MTTTEPIIRQQNEDRKELDRIMAFSDGVFAIAITLLAFAINLPSNIKLSQLGQEIVKLLPQFGIFALTFILIGDHWVIHHRIFRNIRRYDMGLLWINLLFLLCIAFLPVPSRIFGLYPTERPAVIFFSGCLVITGILQVLLWRYASDNHRLLDKTFSPKLVRWGRIRGLIPPTVYMVSIAIALVNPILAILSWGLIFIGFTALDYFLPRD
jgi:TMEM175 potassium channel family protein